jgi:hypothetical protein
MTPAQRLRQAIRLITRLVTTVLATAAVVLLYLIVLTRGAIL